MADLFVTHRHKPAEVRFIDVTVTYPNQVLQLKHNWRARRGG